MVRVGTHQSGIHKLVRGATNATSSNGWKSQKKRARTAHTGTFRHCIRLCNTLGLINKHSIFEPFESTEKNIEKFVEDQAVYTDAWFDSSHTPSPSASLSFWLLLFMHRVIHWFALCFLVQSSHRKVKLEGSEVIYEKQFQHISLNIH